MINVVAFDPSLRNWGVATADYDGDIFHITDAFVISTENTKGIKQNESDILAAHKLYTELLPYVESADIITIEVPHGSQSSRAMVSYAVCVALIASLRATNSKMVHVSANEVKSLVRTDKDHKPTKKEVIQWVRDKHPTLELPIAITKAEHPCDAIVAMHVASSKQQFKDLYHEYQYK